MRASVSMFAAFAVLALLATSAASAQDGPLSVAWSRYREADFEAALSVLAAAEADGALQAEDYPRALEIRALAAHALGRHDLARETLRVLAAVDPRYGLGPEAVPSMREQLDAFRREDERVQLSVLARADGAEVEVRARVTHDPLALVRSVTVFAREAGDSDWTTGEGRVRLPAGSGGDVEHWAEALGPADVQLASRGSAEDPLRLSATGDDGGGGVGWFLALGGAAVVAAGVVIAVLLVTSEGEGATVRPMPPW